jgi:hypothetical protein
MRRGKTAAINKRDQPYKSIAVAIRWLFGPGDPHSAQTAGQKAETFQ